MADIELPLADEVISTETTAAYAVAVPSQQPSIGRMVHFFSEYLKRQTTDEQGINGMGAGPYLATVTQVVKDENGEVTYVNLWVQPPFRDGFHEGSVAYEGATYGDAKRHWAWPERV